MAAEGVIEMEARLTPVVDKLITMMGAARDAFNRHSRGSLEDLKKGRQAVVKEIKEIGAKIEAAGPSGEKTEAERFMLMKMRNVLSHLEVVAETIGDLADPIHRKVQGGVLFSDKAVAQTNYLFDQHTGMIRSVLDIIKTDNEFLKRYVLEEGKKLNRACIDFATEHEARMIEGVCLPQAAPIFLAILDRMRVMAQHETDIAGLLAKKS